MNISLSEQLKEKIKTRIIDGDFSNSSDYFRHLVRQDIARQEEERKLTAFIQAGIDSGLSKKSSQQVFSEIREFIKAKSA